MRLPTEQVQIKKRSNLEATQSLRAKGGEDQVKKLRGIIGKYEKNLEKMLPPGSCVKCEGISQEHGRQTDADQSNVRNRN